ncbi:MAG: DUF4097 domain-containing protein [Deltaproteobacteria bacterium]|nr:DUF4097 domain-containing protein [Deltaproteobacteria bacterium]
MNRFARSLLPCSLLLSLAGCDGDRRVATVERGFEVDGFATLLLDQREGDLTVIGEQDRESITVVAELRAARLSDAQDDEAERALRVGLTELDPTTARIAAGLDDAPRGYYVDVTVIVPSYMTMEVSDESGDATFENLAALTLDDRSGDVRISDIQGTVVIDDDSGDMHVTNVGGDLVITDDSGDLGIRDVGGDLLVRDTSGDIVVDGVAGGAEIDDRSGDIVVRDVGEMVSVTDRSGDILIVGAGDARIVSDTSGDVLIR